MANALSGRQQEATQALFATLSLTRNPERPCPAALNALASYGEPLRAPAQALLFRVRAQGRTHQSPYCAWPPNWSAGVKFP